MIETWPSVILLSIVKSVCKAIESHLHRYQFHITNEFHVAVMLVCLCVLLVILSCGSSHASLLQFRPPSCNRPIASENMNFLHSFSLLSEITLKCKMDRFVSLFDRFVLQMCEIVQPNIYYTIDCNRVVI